MSDIESQLRVPLIWRPLVWVLRPLVDAIVTDAVIRSNRRHEAETQTSTLCSSKPQDSQR